MNTIAVLTTIDSKDDARAIAKALVERKLAACVQISEIESVYSWEEQIQQSPEYRLLVKTTDERYPQVEDAIRELHTYDLPAILGFRMQHVYEPFAAWVAGNACGST